MAYHTQGSHDELSCPKALVETLSRAPVEGGADDPKSLGVILVGSRDQPKKTSDSYRCRPGLGDPPTSTEELHMRL